MILGCDAAGLDEDGNEVVVHAVVSDPSWTGDETLDPKRSLLSERYQGTFADKVVVPAAQRGAQAGRAVSFEEAACLPTAWLTAYRMLFTQGGLKPGDSVLVQGAGGGVATALIALGRAGGPAGLRDQPRRGQAASARSSSAPTRSFESGARLPERVDAVMETVGEATWSHSLKSLRPGGTLVDLRRDQRPEPRQRRADPGLLPAAAGDRLDDGHPRRARGADRAARRERRPPGDRPGAADGAGRATGSPRWPAATSSARSSSPADRGRSAEFRLVGKGIPARKLSVLGPGLFSWTPRPAPRVRRTCGRWTCVPRCWPSRSGVGRRIGPRPICWRWRCTGSTCTRSSGTPRSPTCVSDSGRRRVRAAAGRGRHPGGGRVRGGGARRGAGPVAPGGSGAGRGGGRAPLPAPAAVGAGPGRAACRRGRPARSPRPPRMLSREAVGFVDRHLAVTARSNRSAGVEPGARTRPGCAATRTRPPRSSRTRWTTAGSGWTTGSPPPPPLVTARMDTLDALDLDATVGDLASCWAGSATTAPSTSAGPPRSGCWRTRNAPWTWPTGTDPDDRPHAAPGSGLNGSRGTLYLHVTLADLASTAPAGRPGRAARHRLPGPAPRLAAAPVRGEHPAGPRPGPHRRGRRPRPTRPGCGSW